LLLILSCCCVPSLPVLRHEGTARLGPSQLSRLEVRHPLSLPSLAIPTCICPWPLILSSANAW
jgi:hypothetical protein